MPAAARLNDAVYTDDPDDGRIVGAIIAGSPNVFINEGSASSARVSVPAADALAAQAALDDYVANPSKYKQSASDIQEGQIKQNYAGTVDTSNYKLDMPPDPTNPPNVATPTCTGDRFSFVGGNQSTASFTNNPTGGGVSNSYPTGWTTSTGKIIAVIRPPSAAAVIPFLDECLANKSAWVETGMGGGTSNPNIVNIWRELGFPQSGVWLSDQTAWCAGFVQFVLKKSGMKWMPEAGAVNTVNNASKINATKVNIADMQPGDIVLWSYHHVNFVYKRW